MTMALERTWADDVMALRKAEAERDALAERIRKANSKWEELERNFYLTNDALAEQNRALRAKMVILDAAWTTLADDAEWECDCKVCAAIRALSSQPPTVSPSAPEWLNQALNEGDGVYRP